MSLRIPADPLTAFGHAGEQRRLSNRAFSLVDLTVSIGVMSLLIAILLPSLSSATEQARRVRCSTQVRQVGLALQMYTFDNKDELPPSVYESGLTSPGHADQMIYVRIAGQPDGAPQWDGLGILHALNYLNHPGVFYCPSHHGSHEYGVYAAAWTGQTNDAIAGNLHYRVPPTRSLSELSSYATLVADGMRRRSDYNHEIGNNYLKADLSVGWYYDRNALLASNLVGEGVGPTVGDYAVDRCWDVLDTVSPGSDTGFDPSSMPSNQTPLIRGGVVRPGH